MFFLSLLNCRVDLYFSYAYVAWAHWFWSADPSFSLMRIWIRLFTSVRIRRLRCRSRSCSSSKSCKSANLVYRPSTGSFQASSPSSGLPWLHFELPQLMNFDFDTDPDPVLTLTDPAFHSDSDPDLTSQNDADPDPQYCWSHAPNYPKTVIVCLKLASAVFFLIVKKVSTPRFNWT